MELLLLDLFFRTPAQVRKKLENMFFLYKLKTFHGLTKFNSTNPPDNYVNSQQVVFCTLLFQLLPFACVSPIMEFLSLPQFRNWNDWMKGKLSPCAPHAPTRRKKKKRQWKDRKQRETTNKTHKNRLLFVWESLKSRPHVIELGGAQKKKIIITISSKTITTTRWRNCSQTLRKRTLVSLKPCWCCRF